MTQIKTIENETTTRSFLSFRIMEETFAIDVLKVIEILELSKVTRVPQSPEFMLGVINLRGNVLPVIDARIKFGMPKKEATVDSCIIVITIETAGDALTLGILVDAVNEVMEISANAIQKAPTIGSQYSAEFIEGLVKVNEEFIMILDIGKALTHEELSHLQLNEEASPDSQKQ